MRAAVARKTVIRTRQWRQLIVREIEAREPSQDRIWN
jgi:hypothetical protein